MIKIDRHLSSITKIDTSTQGLNQIYQKWFGNVSFSSSFWQSKADDSLHVWGTSSKDDTLLVIDNKQYLQTFSIVLSFK